MNTRIPQKPDPERGKHIVDTLDRYITRKNEASRKYIAALEELLEIAKRVNAAKQRAKEASEKSLLRRLQRFFHWRGKSSS